MFLQRSGLGLAPRGFVLRIVLGEQRVTQDVTSLRRVGEGLFDRVDGHESRYHDLFIPNGFDSVIDALIFRLYRVGALELDLRNQAVDDARVGIDEYLSVIRLCRFEVLPGCIGLEVSRAGPRPDPRTATCPTWLVSGKQQ